MNRCTNTVPVRDIRHIWWESASSYYFCCALRFYSIYENLDVGSHIHNNRSTEELCKFRFAIIRGVCTVFVRFLSAFATWQNKSIIIVCHWNIVNFHQSHKTNGTTHRDNRPFVLWRIRCFGIDNVQCARIEQAKSLAQGMRAFVWTIRCCRCLYAECAVQ